MTNSDTQKKGCECGEYAGKTHYLLLGASCNCFCHQEKATIEKGYTVTSRVDDTLVPIPENFRDNIPTIETTGFLHAHPNSEECRCFEQPTVTTTSAPIETGDWRTKFENQSFVRVMKDAQDFNKAQYDLLLKLFDRFLRETHQQLLNEVIEMCDEFEKSYLIQKVYPTDPEIVKASFNSRQATMKAVKSLLENKRDSYDGGNV